MPAGALAVHRSAGSVKWVSQSTILMPCEQRIDAAGVRLEIDLADEAAGRPAFLQPVAGRVVGLRLDERAGA